MNKNNPYADFGKIVTGQRFIGRQKEVKTIKDRLLGSNFGNIAIMGLPRIGKTSLVYNTLNIHSNELLKDKIIVLNINAGEINNSKQFFDILVFELYYFFDENRSLPIDLFSKIENLKYQMANENISEIEFSRYFNRFFKLIRNSDYRVIFIIDEFDNVKRYFRVSDFQLLRNISTNPETQVALLTISRKTLQEIEPDNGALSNFYQIFYDLHLGFFDGSDYLKYWEFARGQGVDVKKKTINDIEAFTSAHPFLLDLINNELFNNLESHSFDFEKSFNETLELLKLKILNEYSSIIKLMKEEGLASPAIQLIVGPTYNVTQIDIEKLLKYQLIKFVDNKFVGFSDYFHDYLKISQEEVNVWPLWSETESELRSIIKIHLTEKYGEEWEEKFKKANPKKIKTIDSLSKTKEKNKKAFGELASDSIVDYTYPSDMIDCFFNSDWNWFSEIFKKQFKDWKPIFDHLSKIRNPMAHNNLQFITKADKNRAIGYCQEITSLIQEWKKESK